MSLRPALTAERRVVERTGAVRAGGEGVEGLRLISKLIKVMSPSDRSTVVGKTARAKRESLEGGL